MKPSSLLPALTAVIGFSIAWFAKPSATPPAAQVAGALKSKSSTKLSARDESTTTRTTRAPLKEVNAGDFPLADAMDQGPKTRDEARMLRLSEALGLSLEQQTALIATIEKAQEKIDSSVSVIEDLAARGKMIEAGLASILSPEQLEKLTEIRARERENCIEVRATSHLVPALELIDLSPGQREEIMSRLRQYARAELQIIPASASLLFDNSILPTSSREMSIDGLLVTAKMNEQYSTTDPIAAMTAVQNKARQELEDILACFGGILTPGQMGQYQASMSEKIRLQNYMREAVARGEKGPGVAIPAK